MATDRPEPIQNQPKIVPAVESMIKPVVIPIEAINPPLANTFAAPNFVAK